MTLAHTDPRVHVRAPGKVNVFFAVGPAAADGYHDVASVYQALSLYEDVVATPGDGITVGVTGEPGIDVLGVPRDERNLAARAAALVARELGTDAGVHLHLHKSVPVAGGMGGGSADAAAALVACDALWGGGLDAQALHGLAAQLGADVPFALMGGTAVGTGRGDVLNPALARGRIDWVLVTGGQGLATPRVYGELDDLRARGVAAPAPEVPAVDPAVLHAVRAGDAEALAAVVRNDLQPAAVALRPDLADVLEAGVGDGALAAIVSGSGPTVALLAGDPDHAVGIATAMELRGHSVHLAHGPVPGAKVMAYDS